MSLASVFFRHYLPNPGVNFMFLKIHLKQVKIDLVRLLRANNTSDASVARPCPILSHGLKLAGARNERAFGACKARPSPSSRAKTGWSKARLRHAESVVMVARVGPALLYVGETRLARDEGGAARPCPTLAHGLKLAGARRAG